MSHLDEFPWVALRRLFEIAEETQLGIAFIPSGDQWTILHINETGWKAHSDQMNYPAGTLAQARGLELAARAAELPLERIGNAYGDYIDRHGS